jgi:hypothetical protein
MRLLALIVCSLATFTASGRAQNLESTPVPLQASMVKEPVETIEPSFRAYVSSGSNQFAFLVPHGFRFQGDPASGRVTLANSEGNRSITFSILGPRTAEKGEAMAETYKNLVLNRHPSSTIVRQFFRNAAGSIGPAFDVQWKAFGDTYQCQRAVLLSTPAGLLEITATSSRADFSNNQANLDLLLATLQFANEGKIKVIHLSPNS